MSFIRPTNTHNRNIKVILLAFIFQGIIVWVFISGLAKQVSSQIEKSMNATLIEELKHLPKPEVPKPKITQKVYVAKSEVNPPVSTTSIQTTTTPPPPVEFAASPSIPADPVVPIVNSAKIDLSGGCQKPQYPEMSRFNGEQGVVVVGFLISIEGQVKEGKVLVSSGYPALDKAAKDALALCKFQAGSENGQKVESWAKIRYEWRLSKS
jgi:protein TonB